MSKAIKMRKEETNNHGAKRNHLAMDFLTTLILESLEAAPPVTCACSFLMAEQHLLSFHNMRLSLTVQEKIRV